MGDQTKLKTLTPVPTVEIAENLSNSDLNDLCDATDAAIEAGGGFGWVDLPSRQILERYWQGVLAMPMRTLFLARLDHVICGTCQLVKPPGNNEAQSFAAQLTTNFIAPWARGHRLATMLLELAEDHARKEGFQVINLDVRETMTEAIVFYEKMGYERIGTHPYYAKIKGEVLKGHYYTKLIK